MPWLNKRLQATTSIVAIGLLSSTAFADDQVCKAQQSALNGVGQKYKPQFDQYQQDGNDLEKSAAQFNFHVTWKDVDIIFGLPTATLKDQDLIVGLPQVTMKTKEMIFSTPSVRMEVRQTGELPEFTCDKAFIPHCTIHWSPILTKVPVPFMQEQHIKLDIPEFTFADTKITLGIPEFSIEQQHWILGLPQFTLDSVYLNSGEIKDRSEALQSKIGTTRSAMVSDTAQDIHSLFDCERSAIVQSRAEADAKFVSGLSMLDALIQNVRAQGGDPSKFGDGSNLVDQRAKLNDQRVSALAKFDDAINKLNQSEKDAITSLGGAAQPADSKLKLQSVQLGTDKALAPQSGGAVSLTAW